MNKEGGNAMQKDYLVVIDVYRNNGENKDERLYIPVQAESYEEARGKAEEVLHKLGRNEYEILMGKVGINTLPPADAVT